MKQGLSAPRRLRQTAHAYPSGLDHGEVAGPVISRLDEPGEVSPGLSRLRHWQSKEHDAALRRKGSPKGELSEVLVECHKDAQLVRRPGEHIVIRHARRINPHPSHIVAGRPQFLNGDGGQVLISQEPHLFRGVDALSAKHVAGIGETRIDVILCQNRVLTKNIGVAPAVREQADDKVDGEPSPANNRFAGKDFRVERYARVAVHALHSTAIGFIKRTARLLRRRGPGRGPCAGSRRIRRRDRSRRRRRRRPGRTSCRP